MRDSGTFYGKIVRLAAVAAIATVGVSALPAASAPAVAPSSATVGDATAAELLTGAFTAYGANDFAKAADFYGKFLTDFGKSAEAAAALPQILPLYALALVHLEKWPEASETIGLFLTTHAAKAPAATIEDMKFWEGVSLLKQDQEEEARGKFEAFITAYPRSTRIGEVRLMEGITYILKEDYQAAGNYFEKIKNLLAASQRSRAVLLELNARVENDEKDDALKIIVEEYPNLAHTTQIAGFELLALQLGSDFLVDGEYRKAIAAFQRIWSADRIAKHSRELLATLEKQQADATQRHLDPNGIFQIKQNIEKVNADLEAMAKVPHFDSALQLRLATAYQGMKRYREAAIVMDRMLAEMPADPIVEKASVNLVQCWAQIGRWPKAIAAADTFAKTFPQSADLPTVLFLKAQALSADQHYAEAIAIFSDLATRFPQSAVAPRSLFMKGYTQLVNQENAPGIATLEAFATTYPQDPLNDTAFYWRGMGWSLSGQHDKARATFADYLKKYPSGEHVSEAHFRSAYDAQSAKKYDVSIVELRAFLKDFPKDPAVNDARLLLGDALMAKGQVDDGIKVLRQITPDEPSFFEQGYFKIAKALRLEEKPEAMRAHLERFIAEHPKSNRVAEATYWIGWSWRQANEIDKARETYWRGIQNLGNDPAANFVEDLLTGVTKLYKGEDEKARLLARFQSLQTTAASQKQNVLAVRCLWAQAQIVKKSDPAGSDAFLLKAIPLVDVQVLNPQLLADFADALQRAGKTPEATAMYRDLVKWNPRAVQRDRAFAGLGRIALAAGQETEALEDFNRFENETFGSPLFGEILLQKAKLEKKQGLVDASEATLAKVLANKFVGSKSKAEALCMTGDIFLEKGDPAKAVPYYQKIYVMYGRWTDFVARAYLGSGTAFEKLKNREAAMKTYQEMVARPELAQTAELVEAQARLTKLEAGA